MSTIATRSPLSFARASAALTLVAAVAKTVRAWKNRQQIYRLGEMSDQELSDIGLTRSDLYLASEVSLFEDPTARLRCTNSMRSRESAARC
ncbi:MAG: DUF1127 domain-containing protein [Rhizobiaceae bacterium]